MLSKFVLVLCLFITLPAIAKKEMVIFGGGGEPPGETTIFDDMIRANPLYGSRSGWDITTYFDGGHAASERIAAEKSGGSNKPMTSANVKAEIENLKARLRSGDLKAGDQLLLSIATHGMPKRNNQTTHSVSTTDGSFDLDELIELRDLAEEKGVRLGIMDMSCHSGAMLSLGTDKTCVVTAANDDIGYNRTGISAAQNLNPGLKDLEGVFLFARQDTVDHGLPASPQISSEAGLLAYEQTRFATEVTLKGKTLEEGLRQASPLVCETPGQQNLRRLAADITDIERNTETGKLRQPLIDAVRNYESLRLRSRETIASINAEISRANKEVCGGLPQICTTFSKWRGIYRGRKAKKGPFSPEQEARIRAAELIINTPEYQHYEDLVNRRSREANQLEAAAAEVSRTEHKVYQDLYEYYQKRSTAPNPCKDFKI